MSSLRILLTHISCRFIADRYRRRKARAIAALPDSLRTVYRMKHENGLDDAAIAARLGISERDVMRHRARAALHITQSLDRQYRRAARWHRLWPFGRRGSG